MDRIRLPVIRVLVLVCLSLVDLTHSRLALQGESILESYAVSLWYSWLHILVIKTANTPDPALVPTSQAAGLRQHVEIPRGQQRARCDCLDAVPAGYVDPGVSRPAGDQMVEVWHVLSR